jgi:hypothetical protein
MNQNAIEIQSKQFLQNPFNNIWFCAVFNFLNRLTILTWIGLDLTITKLLNQLFSKK